MLKIFDAHFHIINPKFPLVENNGYLPPSFTTDDYLKRTKDYHLCGGAIVSGSFQAFDQTYLIDALATLGSKFYGVANIPVNIPEEELAVLHQANVVGVRFNLMRGGSEKVEHIEKLSWYLFEKYGWHTELYVDSKELKDLRTTLKKLPLFSIDHLGLSKEGLEELYYWAEHGIRIKATGFGRIDFDPIPVMKSIYRINPKSLMFGTDLPSTRAKIPFSDKDIQLLLDNFSTDELHNILYQNALEWYQK